jgi:1-deoxy-D-xylulose-5-phosphate synthase
MKGTPDQLEDGRPPIPVGTLLAGIREPRDLDKLSIEELGALSEEMRAFLLESVQRTGGHLGSNLGVIELTVALHRVFDMRRDKLIFDVSHQCYPHKLLTGRLPGFEHLRQTGGLCGYTNPEESPYDLFHTGHAGTSISLGLGVAAGTNAASPRPHVISVIGDASLASGVAFEALSAAGASGERLLVILNDNEWSISRSVGALARYLSRIRSNRVLQRAQQEIQGLMQSIPALSRKMDQLGEVLRHSLVPGHVFEELGVSYVGPLKGHDVGGLIESLERVSHLDGVTLLHILTEKGRGHPTAATHPERHHAAKPAPYRLPSKREAQRALEGPSYTKAFANALDQVAKGDLRVHAIIAGMPSGTGLVDFAEKFPARFHDVGICEQHGVALAAGMAKAGLRPVVAIYSTFLQRAYDQVFQEVALQNLPVLFCMDRSGLVGGDGPTHHGVFDLAYLRCLPNMVLASPRDATDMQRMLEMYLRLDGPMAMRYPRGNCPIDELVPGGERRSMEPGKAELLSAEPLESGAEVAIWALGPMVAVARQAARDLAEAGVPVTLVDARFAKPLDTELLVEHAKAHRLILTLEEHQRAGGFGSAVLEALSRERGSEARARVRTLAIGDHFIDHMSSRDEQLAAAGIAAVDVVRAVEQGLSSVRA